MSSSSANWVIVIGSGLAGLVIALRLAPLSILLMIEGVFGVGGSSAWAQRGIAAADGADDDTDLHAQDSLAAGAGFGDPRVARDVAAEAATVVGMLTQRGCSAIWMPRVSPPSRSRRPTRVAKFRTPLAMAPARR